jgi:excisionase family DNA binding protein
MYLTAAEARERLGVSRETLRKLIKSQALTAHKISDGPTSPYRISEEAIQAYLDLQTAKVAS